MAKKQKPSFYRTTISIPYDLKERMDAADDRVNWSEVAARSFELKLSEMAARKLEKNMDDVIQRLRSSQLESNDAHFSEGVEAGKEWVKDTAEADELKRLERFREKCGHEWDEVFDDDRSGSAWSVAEWLYFKISPHNDGSRMAAKEFWEMAVGEGHDEKNGMFYMGFAEGALQLWGEVKEKL